MVLPMPMMGSTAPGSQLATTLLANCETIGALCLVQAAEPGTPFVYAPIALTMDARSGRYAGTTAHSAVGVAGVEMARHYGLPVMGSGSGTDAFVPGRAGRLREGVQLALRPAELARPDGRARLPGRSHDPQPRPAADRRRGLPHVPQGARGHRHRRTIAGSSTCSSAAGRGATSSPSGRHASTRGAASSTCRGSACTSRSRRGRRRAGRRWSTKPGLAPPSCSPHTSRCPWATTSSASSVSLPARSDALEATA